MTKKKSKAIAVIETPTGAHKRSSRSFRLAQDDRGLIAYNYYDPTNNAQYGSETAALTQQEVMQRQEDEQRRIAALPKPGPHPDTEQRPHIKKFWPRLGRQE
jgi:hypothetical protein